MNKLIIVLALSFILSNASAQVPGYMGLKFSLQYQGSISPEFNDFTSHTLVPYYSHNVQMGYVVSRKYEIGLQYTRLDYSSDFSRGIEDFNTESAIAIDHRSFTGNNLTGYIKIFAEKKGYIAPLGRYIILGLTYQNSIDKFHVTQDGSSPIGVPNYTIVQSQDVALAVGAGRNIILFDRVLLTIEGGVSVPFTSGIRAGIINSYSNGDGGGGVTKPFDQYKYQNAVDVMLMNLLQIKIGLGFLAF